MLCVGVVGCVADAPSADDAWSCVVVSVLSTGASCCVFVNILSVGVVDIVSSDA